MKQNRIQNPFHGYTINELREDLRNVERVDKDEK